eukprot:TRINITY_DN16700_c0_g1_i2.p1 TRINITY_DN16700_c0_g1~~TRINITY_DN16700_c0_g1_i2.p1  ORF type:complete len:338 (-),score=30.08 TRINITY_DN16700_c0_g1_i2:113-1126(-)
MSDLVKELLLMTGLKSPNVIKAFAFHPPEPESWCRRGQTLKIMMEPAMGGEIWESFTKKLDKVAGYSGNPLVRFGQKFLAPGKAPGKTKQARRDAKVTLLSMMLVRTLRGLSVIHKAGWVHTDLKPDNIWSKTSTEEAESCMENLSCDWLIGDLGLVYEANQLVTLNGKATGIACAPIAWGTRAYQPREVRWGAMDHSTCKRSRGFWTFQGDVYALAYSLEKSVLGVDYQGLDADDTHATIGKKNYLPQELRQLLESMTAEDFKERPTAEDALQKAEAYFSRQFGQELPTLPAHDTACLARVLDKPKIAEPRKEGFKLLDMYADEHRFRMHTDTHIN